MDGMHFERMAAEYAEARPPYPHAVFEALSAAGAIGPGVEVLEIGAGAGLATVELVRAGARVTAVEPGAELAAVLRQRAPDVTVVQARVEDAVLPESVFDSAVAAMAMHWVDLDVALPRLHAALRAGGWLAVWRTHFGDDTVRTEFRDRVREIVAARPADDAARRSERPTIEELAAGGWFEPVRSERWRWSVDLTTDQVRRLFRTFSNWTEDEVAAAAAAADELGGRVTEHYVTVLHLLRRSAAVG